MDQRNVPAYIRKRTWQEGADGASRGLDVSKHGSTGSLQSSGLYCTHALAFST